MTRQLLKQHWPSLLGFFAVILIIQLIGAGTTFPNITWYDGLRKPDWNPPRGSFGPIWTVLYATLIYIGWRLWIAIDGNFWHKLQQPAIALFCLQLFFNCLWSPVFFGLHLPKVALGVIAVMILLTVATYLRARQVNRIAAYWLLPYLLWVCYAAGLNGAIVALN